MMIYRSDQVRKKQLTDLVQLEVENNTLKVL